MIPVLLISNDINRRDFCQKRLLYLWFNEVFPSKFWLVTSSVSGNLHALHIQNLLNCYRHKDDLSSSRIFQFNFWLVFAIWPNLELTQWFQLLKVDALHVQNLSNSCRHKDDSSISRIFQSIFCLFLPFDPI